jgi:hypothetical protein
MRLLLLAAALIALTPLGFAQTAARDAPAGRREGGPDRDIYTLPKVLVIVDKGDPPAGSAAAFLTDPWGTRIERREQSALSQKPARQ